jgi:Tn3 transposase DDE domain
MTTCGFGVISTRESANLRASGFGGIAFRLVSDTYIALFSHFIPCGVWEAVYLLDSLLANDSDIQPDQVHADTQGQSIRPLWTSPTPRTLWRARGIRWTPTTWPRSPRTSPGRYGASAAGSLTCPRPATAPATRLDLESRVLFRVWASPFGAEG